MDKVQLIQFYQEIGIDFVMDANIKQKPEDLELRLSSVSSVEELKRIVCNFSGCELKETAKNTVFSDGSPDSSIMLIGEAPGEQEDIKGIPFCGKSGKLLDKMLESINLNRDKVYITNVVFWRPPANRKPTKEEIEICKPFLEHHIRLFAPKIIILIGGVAASSILKSEFGISKLRGKFYEYKNESVKNSIPVTAIFHPAYLLRQPMQKKLAWEDLQLIKRFLDEKNIV